MRTILITGVIFFMFVTSSAANVFRILPPEELGIPESATHGIILKGERVTLNGESFLYMYEKGVHVGYALTGDVYWVRFKVDADARPPFEAEVLSDNDEIYPPGKIFSVILHEDTPAVFKVYNSITVENERIYNFIVNYVNELREDMDTTEKSVIYKYTLALREVGNLCSVSIESAILYEDMSVIQRREVLEGMLVYAKQCLE